MEYGVLFPNDTVGSNPVAIKRFATEAESMGCDYLLTYDHILGVDPPSETWGGSYDYTDPFHEPMVLFGFLAGETSSLRLVTGVLVLPQRQTALVAKQAAELAILSEGRFRLGVGVGWNELEYEALGMPYRARGQRIEEQLELLRELWGSELVSMDGRWHDLENIGINPRPKDGVPIWMGGGADVVLDRIARHADGWLVPGASMNRLESRIEFLEERCRLADRDPESLRIIVGLDPADSGRSEWIDRVARLERLGVTHITVNVGGAGDSIDGQLDLLRDVFDAVDHR